MAVFMVIEFAIFMITYWTSTNLPTWVMFVSIPPLQYFMNVALQSYMKINEIHVRALNK